MKRLGLFSCTTSLTPFRIINDLECCRFLWSRQPSSAWNAKEDLLDLLALARTHPDRTVIADRLFRFYDRCAASCLPELERLASTVETWWPEILAFIHTGITNAGSEGTNRVIKTVARDAYGFRCATTRRSRGFLNPA